MDTLTSYGTDWLYLLVPLTLLGAGIAYLAVSGGPTGGGDLIDRMTGPLERITGLPAWSGSGIILGLFALIVAGMGFYWDVAWHIALGRDKFLFTPPHMMILVGLVLIMFSGIVSIAFATREGAGVGFRTSALVFKSKRLVVPYGALCLTVLGAGAVTGFPLDDFWHLFYGVDVTMWGPTHLLMISGASFTPFALWLLLTEAGPLRNPTGLTRTMKLRIAGGLMLGLSTFQGEFDFGVPQFQQLYHPVLIALAASIGLVAARAALGPWGAVKATAFFLVARTLLALLVGQALNLVVPRFPVYIGAALAIEAAALLGRRLRLRPIAGSILVGALVGTAGLASEWGWMQIWGHHPWGTALLPGALVAVAIAIPGAVIGASAGRVLSFRPAGISAATVGLCAVAIVGLMALPFPRQNADIAGTLTTERVGAGRVDVGITVDPANAAAGADWFEVLSWQGGGMQITPLRSEGAGRYTSERPVPVGGNWKSMVRLARKDVLAAAPVYMPADPAIGAHEVPVRPTRQAPFVRDTELLMRETKSGPAWPALASYAAILAVAGGFLLVLGRSYAAVGRRAPVRVRPSGASGAAVPLGKMVRPEATEEGRSWDPRSMTKG